MAGDFFVPCGSGQGRVVDEHVPIFLDFLPANRSAHRARGRHAIASGVACGARTWRDDGADAGTIPGHGIIAGCRLDFAGSSGAGGGGEGAIGADVAEVPEGHGGACQVEVLQAKSRWLPDEDGYVPSGYRTKKRLLQKLSFWKSRGEGVIFLTLTYDPWMYQTRPDWWEGAAKDRREAYYQTDEFQAGCRRCFEARWQDRHLGEFARALRDAVSHRRDADFEWFGALEFQCNGMLHYHLLINCSWIPWHVLDAAWGRGEIKVKSADDGAVGYLAKHLVKGVQAPRWMQDRASRV